MFAKVPFQSTKLSPAVLNGPFHALNNKPEPKAFISNDFADLSCIYQEDINLCLIRRPFPQIIENFVYAALKGSGNVEINQAVDLLSFDFAQLWPRANHLAGYQAWLDDVVLLTSAFCELFERKNVGLRLCTLDKAMCPRFHVDRVPVRLICSYGGIGTEWLPEYALNRKKLGIGGCGMPDKESGLITDPTAIRQMPAYAVGLMKGDNWEGNEGRGLVHRSPTPTSIQPRRLLLTLDML